MNKLKIEYCVAVAIFVIATAFCGCKGKDDDIIALDEVNAEDESLLENQLSENASSGTGMENGEKGRDEELPPNGDFAEKELCVYVCGAVDRPGVYKLSGDIRMIDAITAAGGMKEGAGVQYLNLASKVTDGQKIYVPTTVEIEEAFAAGDETAYSVVNISSDSALGIAGDNLQSGAGTDAEGRVNLNTADKATLMTLPGIGESKADKIIKYREENGGFSSTEDLMLISGIKEGLYNKVKDKIFVK